MTQSWSVRGTLAVEETWTTRAGDGTPRVRRRPLVGVAVEILGFPDARARRSPLGTAVTDAAGRFRVRASRPAWAQELTVRVRFADALLDVDGRDARGAALAWHTLPATRPTSGPHVDLGTLVASEGAAGPLGAVAGSAIAWYVARTALRFLCGRAELTTRTPLIVRAVPPGGDPSAALEAVVRWWVRTHDEAVPVGLVAASVRRALWSRPAERPGGTERCPRDDCVGGPVPHTTAECRAMEARWNAGLRRRTG